MLLALVGDLLRIPVRVSTVWDVSLGSFPLPDVEVEHANPRAFERAARKALGGADLAIIIAPEGEGILPQQHELVQAAGVGWCGLPLSQLEVWADKLASFGRLTERGVPTVHTTPLEPQKADSVPFVVKPRFGAGCEQTFVIRDNHLPSFVSANARDFVAQPFVQGEAWSVAAVRSGAEWVCLPAVRQTVTGRKQLEYRGGTLTLPTVERHTCDAIVRACLDSVETDNGWVGIDFIVTADGSTLVVDVNPRLTTSYIGYRRATSENLAALLLGMHAEEPQWRSGVYRFEKEGRCEVIGAAKSRSAEGL